jgi:hypothetical protein
MFYDLLRPKQSIFHVKINFLCGPDHTTMKIMLSSDDGKAYFAQTFCIVRHLLIFVGTI